MLKYSTLNKFYRKSHRRIWRILFGSNFRRFGKSSTISFPLRIDNAKYIEIGDHVSILNKAWLGARQVDENVPRLIIDDYAKIQYFAAISCVRHVYIGKGVGIGNNVYISDNTYSIEDGGGPIMWQGPVVFKNSVHIGDSTWIGMNVCIIGAKIGTHLSLIHI